MKKLGIAIAVIVVLVIIAALVVPQVIDVNSYRDRIQAELQSRLGRPVTLGQLHLSIIPLAFTADSTAIGDDAAFHDPHPFADVQKLSVSVALMPLLRKDVQIKSLELDQPKIELIRNREGVWNFSTLGQQTAAEQNANRNQRQREAKPEQKAQPEQPSQSAGKSSAQNFSLSDLKIVGGQLAVTDEQARQPRVVYNDIDLRLVNFAPGKPFSLEAAAHLPGAGNQELSLNGDGGPIDQAAPMNTPLKAKVEFKNVSIAGFQKFLNLQQLEGSDAVINGTAQINNAPNNLASSGTLNLTDVKLHGNNLGFPISADYSVSSRGKLLQIEKGKLKLGDTPVTIAGTMNSQPTPAQIDMSLGIANASLGEIARLAAAQGIAFNPGMNVDGKVSADVRAQGAMTQPAMNGTVNASNLLISGKDLPQPVKVPSIHLDLTPQQVSSNNFTATSGGTSLNARFTLAQYTSNLPSVNAEVSTQNANLGELLNIAKAYGVSAAEGMTGSGAISFNVNASGPLKNSSAMTFNGTGQLQNATMKTAEMTQPLKVRNANLRFSQNAATLENLAASVGSTNASGTASVSNFNSPQVKFTLAADKVNVDELEKIFGVSQSGPQKQASFSLVPTAEAAPAQAPSFLQKATGGGAITAGTVSYQNMVLTNLKATAALDHGIIRLDPVTALLYGGQENGAIVMDARTTTPTYTVTSKLAKVDANQLLSSMSSLKQTLYGLLAANTNAHFSSGGDIARSLNGTAGLDLTNGKLAHIDMLYELANIGKFLTRGSTISQKGFTNIAHLAGTFNIQNGVATTNDLKADIDGGSMAAQGAANLADQSLNMKVTAVLNKALAQQVGGTGIGGYMNTALANKNGELVMPVLVTGTFDHPHVAPDVQEIARMKLQNILPTSSNPAAGILGNILGQNGGANQGTQPKGTLQGILNGISKPQQQQQQSLPNGQPQPQQQQQQKKQSWQDIVNGVLKNKQQNQPPPQQSPPPQ